MIIRTLLAALLLFAGAAPAVASAHEGERIGSRPPCAKPGLRCVAPPPKLIVR